MFGVELERSADFTGACAVAKLQGKLPAGPYGIVCFDAFETWPSSLGAIQPLEGGGIAGVGVATAFSQGVDVLTGRVTFNRDGARLARNVTGSQPPAWASFPQFDRHQALFLTPASDGDVVAGLGVYLEGQQQLELHRIEDTGTIGVEGLACAQDSFAANGFVDEVAMYVVASAGKNFGSCFDGRAPGPATRIQLSATMSTDFASTLLFEEETGEIVFQVRAVDAGDAVWIGWKSLSQVTIARVSKTGALLVPPVVVATTGSSQFAMAMRGDELLVGHIDASDPDLGADVVLTAFAPDGASRPFGGFDTSELPWWEGLDLIVSDDATQIVVAYSGDPGTLAARRFECVAPRD